MLFVGHVWVHDLLDFDDNYFVIWVGNESGIWEESAISEGIECWDIGDL